MGIQKEVDSKLKVTIRHSANPLQEAKLAISINDEKIFRTRGHNEVLAYNIDSELTKNLTFEK